MPLLVALRHPAAASTVEKLVWGLLSSKTLLRGLAGFVQFSRFSNIHPKITLRIQLNCCCCCCCCCYCCACSPQHLQQSSTVVHCCCCCGCCCPWSVVAVVATEAGPYHVHVRCNNRQRSSTYEDLSCSLFPLLLLVMRANKPEKREARRGLTFFQRISLKRFYSVALSTISSPKK